MRALGRWLLLLALPQLAFGPLLALPLLASMAHIYINT
jgi:hypothetical protein